MAEEKYRHRYHLMPPKGWMNDPNGLCFYKGCFHVFFQYCPENPEGGLKSWGHYRSEDLLNWTFLGTPLVPDTKWDRDGAYSGSAWSEDGLLELFYTGNTKEEGEHDYVHSGRGANVLYVSSEDGVSFGKKELLLTNSDYPADYTCHVRDPKVWKENDIFYMILGGRKTDDSGAAMIYRSEDKKHWSFIKEITTEKPFGYMWECPDLFSLDGNRILSICPQGLKRGESRFQNIYQSGYFVLSADLLSPDQFREWDMGFDFYAPQTFTDKTGRRLLTGWAGLPDMEQEYENGPAVEEGWQHSLTMFRELEWRNGKIYQKPAGEYEKLRKEETVRIAGIPFTLENCTELEVRFHEAAKDEKIILRFGDCRGDDAEIQQTGHMEFTWENGIGTLAFLNETGCGRRKRQALIGEIKKLQVFLDRSIMEIYINSGEFVFTTRYYMSDNRINILVSENAAEIRTWTLREMKIKIEEERQEEER